MYKIYAGAGTRDFGNIIKKFLLKRESFTLYNIDNNEKAFSVFIELAGDKRLSPLITDEKGNIVEI